MAESSQPSDGAELSLRPQGRKSIGESHKYMTLHSLVEGSLGWAVAMG